MAELLREIRAKWIPEPLPPRDSFEGQTVLVTGGTGGVGLATAKHFANLGAAKVIITYRDKSRGEAARQEIEAAARATGRERVVIETMELDLSRYSSCISFVEELLRRTNGIDVVVLNAGTFNSSFIMSPDGWYVVIACLLFQLGFHFTLPVSALYTPDGIYCLPRWNLANACHLLREETIQANTLSTALLAILLIKWMKAGRQNRQTPASLVFVSSGRHLTPDISEWPEWEKRDGGILLHYKNASNWPSDGAVDAMYATSKLLVMYVFEEICKLAVDAKGE
ncbi:Short chain dehydrogenase yanD [Fusarium oxysporum f. sp. rapae]|uniref:Short chain dehydrogenase yanD n=1 Tax=Fusarium oxysporum f. sp. rapae TaxID=485398 RepID=A0A8J5NGB4_FUSOX|nr:Short chain dehydrogenase yanD [Fusarium oxysporum f. sp. rapae]